MKTISIKILSGLSPVIGIQQGLLKMISKKQTAEVNDILIPDMKSICFFLVFAS